MARNQNKGSTRLRSEASPTFLEKGKDYIPKLNFETRPPRSIKEEDLLDQLKKNKASIIKIIDDYNENAANGKNTYTAGKVAGKKLSDAQSSYRKTAGQLESVYAGKYKMTPEELERDNNWRGEKIFKTLPDTTPKKGDDDYNNAVSIGKTNLTPTEYHQKLEEAYQKGSGVKLQWDDFGIKTKRIPTLEEHEAGLDSVEKTKKQLL